MLAQLDRGEECRIHHAGTERLADHPHGLFGSAKKGSARILNQMPSISHLNGLTSALGGRLDIPRTAVVGDDRDGRTCR